MRRRFTRLAAAAAGAFLCACAADKDAGTTTTTVRKSSGDPLLERFAGNFEYEKGPDGSQRVSSNRRSEFEGKNSGQFAGQYGSKAYQTKAFDSKPWWGSRQYTKSTYAGPTDGSRFQKNSSLAGKSAAEADTVSADAGRSYRTGSYRTGRAREASARPLDKPTDALTESRRETAEQPVIIDWREQRNMQMRETKSLLGRD